METTIRIDCVREPEGFHAVAGNPVGHAFALLLSIDVTADEADPQARVRSFLDEVRTMQFGLHRRAADGTLESVPVDAVQKIVDPNHIDADDIEQWLVRAGRPWFSPALDTLDIDDDNDPTTVSDLLKSTVNWDAPIPQRMSLVALVHVDVGNLDPLPQDVVLMPVGGYGATPVIVHADSLEATRTDANGAMTQIRSGFVAWSQTALPMVRDGFLVAEAGAEMDDRLARRIANDGCSLFWSTPRLLDFATTRLGSGNRGAMTPANALSLAALVTASLLDPLVLAVTLPEKPGSEGLLLGPLVTTHLRDVRKARANPPATPPSWAELLERTSPELIRALWRDAFATVIADGFNGPHVAGFLTALLDIGTETELARWLAHFGVTPTPPVNLDEWPKLECQWRDLLLRIQEESGVEQVLMRLVDRIPVATLVTNWAASANVTLDPTGSEAAATLCQSVLHAWRSFVGSDFNADAAIRQVVGTIYQDALERDASGTIPRNSGIHPDPASERWKLMLDQIRANPHSRNRVSSIPGASAYARVTAGLWRPLAFLEADDLDALDALDEHILIALSRNMGDTPDAKRRFVPDSVPHPLPVRIAMDADPAALDSFNSRYSGIGVLIRRDAETWRHACLAELTDVPPSKDVTMPKWTVPHALRPLTPVASDGRADSFLGYSGFPLASGAFDTEGEGKDALGTERRFYRAAEVNYDEQPAPKVPALRYGSTYRLLGFVVAKSGALPLPLQLGPGPQAWYPKLDLDALAPPQVSQIVYQRRTAIGKIEIDKSGQARLGNRHPDVALLVHDDPRVCVSGHGVADATAFLDLFRNADGSGGITVPAVGAPPVTVVLQRLRHAGTGELKLALCRTMDGNSTDSALIHDAPGTITIEIHADADTAAHYANGTLTFRTPDVSSAYLRLTVSGSRAVSLAEPETSVAKQQYSATEAPPALLLAPPDAQGNKVWRDGFGTFQCTLIRSRVGFLDFDRWPHDPHDLSPGVADDLLLAYVTSVGGQKDEFKYNLAQLLEHLPDPAVAGYVLSVGVLDSESGANTTTVSGWVPRAALPTTPISRRPSTNASPWAIQEWLAKLVNSSNLELTIQSGAAADIQVDATEPKATVTLPEATRARVFLQPAVRSDHLGNRIDERLGQFATGHLKHEGADMTLFPGASILVEVMHDGLGALQPEHLARQFSVRAHGRERRYALEVSPPQGPLAVARAWKQVAWCDVATQRWRFSGKPIYQWLAPRAHAHQQPGRAVLNLDTGFAEIEAFESQLFFDRGDADHDVNERRILVTDETQLLHEVDWSKPSATYDRHRFTVYSRYRGAMRQGTASARSWARGKAGPWTLRVAILADIGRQEITRPQLRALVPLTAGIQGSPEQSPPLAAILEEPPFAIGGLAERILPGIHVGPGYGFDENDATIPVMPLDLRAEVGPDPRLSQVAMAAGDALASTLTCEGPVGLHFEAQGTAVPFFVNSQHLLTPTVLRSSGHVRQESFVAVRMMRWLDPEWVVGSDASASDSVDIHRGWSIAFPDSGAIVAGGVEVVTVIRDDHHWVVAIDRGFLDTAATSRPLAITKIDADRAASIRIQHWPVNSRTCALAVLAMPTERSLAAHIESGESNQPVLLGVLDWTPPASADALQFRTPLAPGARLQTQKRYVSPLTASVPTDMTWARTARNANAVYQMKQDATTGVLPISEVRLHRKPQDVQGRSEVRFSHWRNPGEAIRLVPGPVDGDYPQTVHRHLAAILTNWSDGRGRRFDEFREAVLIRSERLTLKQAERLSAARLLEFQVPARPIRSADPSTLHEVYLDVEALVPAKCYWIRLVLRGNLPLPAGCSLMVRDSQTVKKFPLPDRVFDCCVSWPVTGQPLGADLPMASPAAATVDIGKKGFGVHLEVPGGTVIWGDVSILPLPGFEGNELPSTVLWDWFLHASLPPNAPPKDALAIDLMKQRKESCAQIVSYGPRIGLEPD